MRKLVSKQELLDLANERIKQRPGFVEGMQLHEAKMVGDIVVLYGECFLSPDGGATARTAPAIEFYNEFAAEFVDEYGLLPGT